MKVAIMERQDIRTYVADRVERLLIAKPEAVLALTTGSTPLVTGIYDEWIRRENVGQLDFSRTTIINPDEQIGIGKEHPESYYAYMEQHLFSRIHHPADQRVIPDGSGTDVTAECQRLEQAVENAGGIDWQLVGIGRNGHICFIEPADAIPAQSYVTSIADSNRRLYAPQFGRLEDVPTHAITFGWGTVLKSRELWLVAVGSEKADMVARALSEAVSTQLPATVLQLHANVTVVLDDEAAQKLPPSITSHL